MKQLAFALFALIFVATTHADSFDHQHSAWTKLLQQHVHVEKNGAVTTVDYRALKSNPSALNLYLQQISAVSETSYKQWTQLQQLAFLINAYNAFTVKLIIDYYPVDSIKEIGSLFQSPWKKEFIFLLGKKRSLDEIEHQMIRGQNGFHEPRIHFTVNCASIGCPALRNEAYTADKLDQQLQEATLRFLSDSSRNYVQGDILYLSSIFKWYSEDFGGEASLQKWLEPFAKQLHWPTSAYSPKMNIRYLEYDWRLNDSRKKSSP